MKPKIRDTRAVRLERVLGPDYIPLFGGRPLREKVIGREDDFDLKILLYGTSSVEDFIAKL